MLEESEGAIVKAATVARADSSSRCSGGCLVVGL